MSGREAEEAQGRGGGSSMDPGYVGPGESAQGASNTCTSNVLLLSVLYYLLGLTCYTRNVN